MSAKPRPLARVLASWWVVPAVWVVQLAFAAGLGRWVGAVAASAMRGHTILDDGHFLFALSSLIAQDRAVGTTVLMAVLASATVGAVAWIVMAGGVLRQLYSPGRGGDLVAEGLRLAPRMLAQTVWITVLRGLLLAPAFLPGSAQPFGALVGLLLVALSVPAFDLARAEVALGPELDERGETRPGRFRDLGVRPLLAAIAKIPRAIGHAAASVGLWLLARGLAAGMLYLAISAAPMSQGALWGVRLLALIPIALGIVRLSLAIDLTAPGRKRTKASAD